MDMFSSPDFWIAVGQIIMIDILLGGDNAVVIALACRSLPPAQRTKGIMWGTVGAIVLRVILIFFAITLLRIPFIKIVGALLLIWIGVKLLMPEHDEGHGDVAASDKLWGAVKTVIVADLVMSVDNVIAIAGAAENAGGDHTMPLVVFGLLVSIPIIVWGSQIVLKLMDRFPIVITLGGMLLGWIAGSMFVSDPAIARWVPYVGEPPKAEVAPMVNYGAAIAGALLVLVLGKFFAARSRGRAVTRAAAGATAAVATGVGSKLRSVMLAVDGSEGSSRAVQRLLSLREELREGGGLKVHVVNVQRPVPGDVARFVPGQNLEDYHRERSEEAMVPARQALDAAGLAHEDHQCVGDPGETIAQAARETGSDMIVMGARGLGTHTAALLGSVAQATIEHAAVPVLVVK